VDIWLERFVLALLATAFLSLVILNVMKFDITQRVTLGISIAAFSYFVGHTIKVTRSQTVAKQTIQLAQDSQSTDSSSSRAPIDIGGPAIPPSTNTGPSVRVTDGQQKPLAGVDVLILNANGTHFKMMTTDENGLVELPEKAAGPVAIFCAHPKFHHDFRAKLDLPDLLSIQMQPSLNGGSVIIPDGTGYVPGLDGRLNPILDTQGRMYLYAENIAIEGGKAQPVNFTTNRPLRVDDSHGHRFQLEIISIFGSSSLIEYRRLSGPSVLNQNYEVSQAAEQLPKKQSAGPPLSVEPPPPLTENLHTTTKPAIEVMRHDLNERAGRANIVHNLSEFILQGEKLQSELVDPALSDSTADNKVEQWHKSAREFIYQHMGTKYADNFDSSEGVEYQEEPLAKPNSQVKLELWRSIYARNWWLRQFIQESSGVTPPHP
jgi:hypothetical protein